MELGTSDAATAAIVEALLAVGILKDGDWYENLTQSLVQGLRRWLRDMCARELRYLPLDLVYSDDIVPTADGWNVGALERDGWIKCFNGAPDAPVGGFGLVLSEMQLAGACVGRRVTELEQFSPGAGVAVLGAVEAALFRTVGVASPGWAHAWLADWDYGLTEEEIDPDQLTADRFLEHVPASVVYCKPDEKALRRGLRKCRKQLATGDAAPAELASWERVMAGALELLQQLPACTDNHLPHLMSPDSSTWAVMPLSLAWLPGQCPTIRVLDDYLEMLSQDTHTDYCWISGFQLARPETVITAAEALQRTIKLLAQVDEVIGLLDAKEPPLPIKWRQPRKPKPAPPAEPKPLFEILSGETIDGH